MMLPAAVEKAAYGIAIVVLFLKHSVPTLGFSIVYMGFAALFAVAFWVTREAADLGAVAPLRGTLLDEG